MRCSRTRRKSWVFVQNEGRAWGDTCWISLRVKGFKKFQLAFLEPQRRGVRLQVMTERLVIITGGAGAVGRTVSKRWIDAGASVLIVDHAQATLDRWLADFPGIGGNRIATLATDAASE